MKKLAEYKSNRANKPLAKFEANVALKLGFRSKQPFSCSIKHNPEQLTGEIPVEILGLDVIPGFFFCDEH